MIVVMNVLRPSSSGADDDDDDGGFPFLPSSQRFSVRPSAHIPFRSFLP